MRGNFWRLEDVETLVQLVREGVPLSIVSMKLGRDIGEVESKAADLGLCAKKNFREPDPEDANGAQA